MLRTLMRARFACKSAVWFSYRRGLLPYSASCAVEQLLLQLLQLLQSCLLDLWIKELKYQGGNMVTPAAEVAFILKRKTCRQ